MDLIRNSPVLITWLNGFRVVIAVFIFFLSVAIWGFLAVAEDEEVDMGTYMGVYSILFWQPSPYYIRIWMKIDEDDWKESIFSIVLIFLFLFLFFGWWLPSLTYFAIKFMLKFLPAQLVIPIGLSLSVGCMLLSWIVRRRYHLAQNPLYGILEPSSSKVTSVPSSLSKCWFRLLSKRRGR